MKHGICRCFCTELVFLKVYGAQESIQGMNSASLCSLAGRYDNPIPTRFLAPIDCFKIPAQNNFLVHRPYILATLDVRTVITENMAKESLYSK
jgi:hypothetical protein